MTQRASGTFEVNLTPQTDGQDATLGRLLLDKRFQGDLAATSQGQMLSASTSVANSAGYVAIERVNGTLHDRSGSFVLQHGGTMNRGAPQLTISIVPDSGTEDLTGIAGTMTIAITDGKHSYELVYTINE